MNQPLTYIPEIIESHIDEVSFLYEQYRTEIAAGDDDQSYLRFLAKRLRANIDGLLLNHDVVWELVEPDLAGGDAEVFFTAGIVAFGAGHVQRVKQAVDLAEDEGALAAVAFSLAWLPWRHVQFWTDKFAQSERPELVYLSVYAYLWHRKKNVEDVGIYYPRLLASDVAPQVLSVTLLLVNLIQDISVVPLLRELSMSLKTAGNASPETEFKVLNTRLTLGDNTALIPLKDFLFEENALQEDAAELSFSYLQTVEAKGWLRELQEKITNKRLILIAIGALKERALLPWVINQMQEIELARLAGKTVGLILGVDIEEEGWVIDDEKLDEKWLEIEGDEMLPWPDRNQIKAALGLQ